MLIGADVSSSTGESSDILFNQAKLTQSDFTKRDEIRVQ